MEHGHPLFLITGGPLPWWIIVHLENNVQISDGRRCSFSLCTSLTESGSQWIHVLLSSVTSLIPEVKPNNPINSLCLRLAGAAPPAPRKVHALIPLSDPTRPASYLLPRLSATPNAAGVAVSKAGLRRGPQRAVGGLLLLSIKQQNKIQTISNPTC